ncbi:MAG: vitamin B12-dependent ribonucleotide reductase [Chloroflexi bacterium]|nr:vitamin B12-dependent ribonucleotide reductase [Chloroflexota bacterium]MCI0814084.1 vitamin B12-dependent ribonucleotide reductase [Chloroflexota bacterium]MCI0816730.1 vitamin B12-dependent ribonucleotide reductase [Chloroflexota bacterium]MCI0819420.1 vitamin B12-dependent ribonucleotide reductase [Chloroflexota bacterium]MCI0831512.1 vitamin B12-dependent ribonucleotide reductase [Chloroflexota bacterium]
MTLAPDKPTTTTNTVRNAEASLPVTRFFTKPETDPYDEIAWEIRSAVIAGQDGKPVFEQHEVEFPETWTQNATNVVASKYFRGPLVPADGMVRENSVKQMIDRVVNVIAGWGWDDGYFASEDERETFRAELKYALVNQYLCFNSPVWFNVGVEEKPQCSACFILSIEDSIDSILDWYRTEGRIFKGGSGSGINLSTLRSSTEHVTAGGLASGPVSFMRGADSVAGTIKSGGKTRRAAKMVILNADHPDIIEFVESKAKEEKKAYALGEAGYDMSLDGDAWISIQFQNANNSVRVTDEFMRAVRDDGKWQTRNVHTDGVAEEMDARWLMRKIAQAAWECADPGMQYDTTINDWHTCPNTGPITASNPCAEYMHIDDSACNLASINLLKFLGEAPSADSGQASFDVESYRRVIALSIMAQEILVSNSSYPTEKIGENAVAFRQLGLGYANLGALLMCLGVPYDSDEGRAYAASLTAVMTGEAYATSARVAARMGPFAGYELNREPMIAVMEKHQAATGEIDAEKAPANLVDAAKECWADAVETGREHGYRNAQATVLAPTGTISFMMDCDTTGIEPDIALVKYKTLVGGGLMKIVNGSVERALGNLGYSEADSAGIIAYIDEQGTVEGAPGLADEHLAVFDCAFKSPDGTRTIHWLGHVKMMGAVQPFISGAISKTVNLPEEATVEEIEEAYIEGWKHGVKALAIYRDGSKRTQVLSTSKDGAKSTEAPGEPVRRRLPATRTSVTHKFSIEGHEGYITAGLYEHGAPGEIWLTMAKEGSTLSGMMDAFATSISLALQYGVPLRDLVNKFSHMRFEPSGRTENNEIPVAQSIVDYIFRWLASSFLSEEEKEEFGVLSPAVKAKLAAQEFDLPSSAGNGHTVVGTQTDAPPCMNCGWIMTRAGTCYKCDNCGTTTGCG